MDVNAIGSKGNKEYVTPHRVALLVLIKEVSALKMKLRDAKDLRSEHLSAIEIRKLLREFSISMLKLIQSPDIESQDLLRNVKTFLPESVLQSFYGQLKEIYKQGISGLMDYIMSLEVLIVDPNHPVSVVHKSSVIGLFIRRMLLVFDKLSFSEVTKLYHSYQTYYETYGTLEANDESAISIEVSLLDDNANERNQRDGNLSIASQKQAELLIARQAALLQTNEKEAMPPKELHKHTENLLKNNPGFAEAHFLSYMNSLRVKEYCNATHSIHHCFDCGSDVKAPSGANNDETLKKYCYAALNMAILLHSFGHNNEALLSLREAIHMSQEANDHVCLQHAQSWLYRLQDSNKQLLIERSISKSDELRLPYITSMGILKYSQLKAAGDQIPSKVFEFLFKSDVLNIQHSILELMCTSLSQKAGLWHCYGKRTMMSLSSQLLLHLNASDPSLKGVHLSTEAHCLAICNMAWLLAHEGEYTWALRLISKAAEEFPQLSQISKTYMIEEAGILFQRALLRGHWSEADSALENLVALSPASSGICKVELLLHKGDYPAAHKLVHKLLNVPIASDQPSGQQVRLLLLLGELYCYTKNYTAAIPPVTQAIYLSQQHHFNYLGSLATVHLANIKFHLGSPTIALHLLHPIMTTILADGSPYDQNRVRLLHQRCSAERIRTINNDEKRKLGLAQVGHSLVSLAEGFKKIEAYHRVKEIYFIQAKLFHEAGLVNERNEASFNFRLADSHCGGTSHSFLEGKL